MSKSLDFSAVAAELKQHLVENPEVLRMVLKDDRSFFSYVSLVPGVLDRVLMNRLKMQRIARPSKKDSTFDPKEDALRPDPRYGYVKPNKVDLEFDEEDIEALWKSYLGKLENRMPESVLDMPFQAEIFDMIFAQLKEDDQLEALFKGVRDDDGTEPKDMYDGFLKIISNDITAGKIKNEQIVVTGAISGTNAVDKFELMKMAVPSRFWMRDWVAIASPTSIEYYNKDYRAQFGALPYNQQYQKTVLDGTKIELIAEEGLEGKNDIIITPRYNFKYITAGTGDIDRLRVQEDKRDLLIMLDWRSGVDYAFPEYVYTNKLA
ncbi:hypothetical protein [Xanthocytophaga flava]|uniref:hypothetical protein n=1 Tax=Xanthocytophaga flava TaxID=3048013 RepID=UPI0028D2E9C2|nr:hypothetical protein [Xanthocytophaga flavus]MDJ1468170.1 hypothetical protein [Xanthocytophaga flavus]